MPTHRPVSATNRSAVTNGARAFLGDVDERTPEARRWRDVAYSLAADLGGPDHLSTAQTALVRRSATLVVQCEMDEALLAGGKTFDDQRFLARVNTLRRVLDTLGIERQAKDITPLASILTAKEGRRRKRL
jgi:hypothetical protein